MKRLLAALVALALINFGASGAFAATLVYAPESISVTVAPGESTRVPMTVEIKDALSGTYYVWFADTIGGDIPPQWVVPERPWTFVSKWWPSASTNLIIRVPENAEAGLYSGYVFGKAQRSHGTAERGSGIYLSINVESQCAAKPGIEISAFGPEVLWPPNGSLDTVTVEGTVSAPEGCTLYGIGYSIMDEYDEYTAVGELEVSAEGTFSLAIPVKASRAGQDKDGRHYTVTIFAEDEQGIGTSDELQVLVPHDQRNVK